MNGYKQEGLGRMDLTIKDGRRWSTSAAYLNPILNRPNLFTTAGFTCTGILFHRDRAIGIEFVRQVRFVTTEHVDAGSREKIFCEDSVILAAGAINTPQLLMVSGIGWGDNLYSVGIPIRQEMVGVGQNLQDHLEVSVQQKCKKPITLYNHSTWRHPHNMIRNGFQWFMTKKGLAASSHLESGGFARSSPEVEHPDIQFHFLPSTVHEDGRVSPKCHGFQVHVGPMRSKSIGCIYLQNADPRRAPLCDPNYLSHEQDFVEFRKAVRLSREIFAQNTFDEFRGEELAPGIECQTDEEIDEFVRKYAASAYHPSCTCKMGPSSDKTAVVDPETLNVHGFANLKIADASIMPSIVSGNLNAPVIMIAEKAADIIMGKKPLPPENPPIWSSSVAQRN